LAPIVAAQCSVEPYGINLHDPFHELRSNNGKRLLRIRHALIPKQKMTVMSIWIEQEHMTLHPLPNLGRTFRYSNALVELSGLFQMDLTTLHLESILMHILSSTTIRVVLLVEME
jgi:hypothetical protein